MRLTVSVVGLGLIGGSIGLALGKSRTADFSVVGYDPDPEARAAAVDIGAVGRAVPTIAEAVASADVVFLAAPVSALPTLLEHVVAAAPESAVISDVGSTKGAICRRAERLGDRGRRFIGGHPLAGSERNGVRAADPYLFQNAAYVLTPTRTTDADAVAVVKDVVRHLGAHPLVLTPDDHDVAVAAVSHVPHIAAAALVNAVIPLSDTHPEVLQLAAGGFRDTTRVASGEPALWRDICVSNKQSIRTVLAGLRRELEEVEEALVSGDATRIESFLDRARRGRAQLPKRPKGIALEPAALVTQLSDRPGSLAAVARLLADRGLNIIDAEILRVREGEGGTLRLGFDSPDVLEKAAEALGASGYPVRLV